jgi:hypothetical protein
LRICWAVDGLEYWIIPRTTTATGEMDNDGYTVSFDSRASEPTTVEVGLGTLKITTSTTGWDLGANG